MNPRRRLMLKSRGKKKKESQPTNEAVKVETVATPSPTLLEEKPKTSKASKITKSKRSVRKKTSKAPKE